MREEVNNKIRIAINPRWDIFYRGDKRTFEKLNEVVDSFVEPFFLFFGSKSRKWSLD